MNRIIIIISFVVQLSYIKIHRLDALGMISMSGVPYLRFGGYHVFATGLWFFPLFLLLRYFSWFKDDLTFEWLILIRMNRRVYLLCHLAKEGIDMLFFFATYMALGMIILRTHFHFIMIIRSLLFYMTMITLMNLLEIVNNRSLFISCSMIILGYEVLTNAIHQFDILKYYMPSRLASVSMGIIVWPLFVILLMMAMAVKRKDFI